MPERKLRASDASRTASGASGPPPTPEKRRLADTGRLPDLDRALATPGHSRGCEHSTRASSDERVAEGDLAPGTSFVVHGHDESP